ncbi:MAG: cbb3-type cytochrome c oxidase N-terminal domain-containing protein [Saprospiraceae bacterium]
MKFAKYITTLLILVTAERLWAQDPAVAAVVKSDQLPQIMTYVLLGGAAMLFIVAMVYMIKVNQMLYRRLVNMEAARSGAVLPEEPVALEPREDFWTRMRKKYWEDAVPVEREADIMLHHNYDGIRELDNSLPPWWVNMFIITIICGAIYMFYYHFGGGGPLQAEEYEREMEKAKKEIAIALAGKANAVDESNVTLITDALALGEGELIFKNSCAACHGAQGEGNAVGPNLTDEYWLHGGGIQNVFKTIKYGVPEKGMISWQSQLKAADMQKVASYILSLQGTNPPNAKDPQGEIWKPEADDESSKEEASGQTGSVN